MACCTVEVPTMIKSNLAVLMAERDLRIVDVWKKTGISKVTLYGLYHNNTGGVQWETLDKLCAFLNVDPGQLLVYCNFAFSLEPIGNNIRSHVQYNARQATGLIRYDVADPLRVTVHAPASVATLVQNVPMLFRNDFDQRLDEVIRRMQHWPDDHEFVRVSDTYPDD